jgi:hypothetical protein
MIARLRDSSSSGAVMDCITADIEMLSVDPDEENILRLKVNRRLLTDLSYPEMTNRYEDITEAYAKTFDWIFSDTRKWELPWNDFGEWLREDGNIYWIRGKAGSGKSTLMKYIYDDQRTKKCLQKWARRKESGSVPCCVATFFFWNSGTDLQQSQRGLIRALLYQVLEQNPLLIPIVFPESWAEIYSEVLEAGESLGPKIRSWSNKQLREAFERLVTITQEQYPLKICFIVDGLDEFSGDPDELCIFFQRLSRLSESVKFCLSSRSWVVFQEALENCPGLRLQDLTTRDIDTYINGKFKESSAFLKLVARDETLASSLTREISNRAEGVFLWVRIVVHQLIRGLNNRDGAPQLWRRLQSFPRELNPLYDSILSQIEPIYLEWAARAFEIMNASTELSSDPFRKQSKELWPVDETRSLSSPPPGKEGVNLLTLIEFTIAVIEDNDVEWTQPNDLPLMYEDLRVQLTARCAGLLEISDTKRDICHSHGDCYEHVRWMHRTARDFVNQDARWMKLLHNNSPPDFSAHFTLMRSSVLAFSIHLRLSKRSANPKRDSEVSAGWAAKTWLYAYHANGHNITRKKRTALLKRLSEMQCGDPNDDHNDELSQATNRELLLRRATKLCLSDFVEDILSENKSSAASKAADLLAALCDYLYSRSNNDFPIPTVQMVKSLLKMGVFAQRHVDTDLKHNSPTPTKRTIPMTLDVRISEIPVTVEKYLSVIEALLEADVDPINNLSFVPRDFRFCKKGLQERVKEALHRISGDTPKIIHIVEKVIWEEVKVQQSQKRRTKKRKAAELCPDALLVTSESDSETYLGDGPAGSSKRVKPTAGDLS